MNRRQFLLLMAQLGAFANITPPSTFAESKEPEWPEMSWWYRSPASRYWEGIPLSNGRLAAMVYGGIEDELIPINEESLWSGSPYNPDNPEGRAALPEIRRLLLEGRYVEAQELCRNLIEHSALCSALPTPRRAADQVCDSRRGNKLSPSARYGFSAGSDRIYRGRRSLFSRGFGQLPGPGVSGAHHCRPAGNDHTFRPAREYSA